MPSHQMAVKIQNAEPEPFVYLVVYLVFSPESEPGYRYYSDEDIQVVGGIHAIERELEKESYWFARLGEIQGDETARGVTFGDSARAELPLPQEGALQIGRRNPAFVGSVLERVGFRAIFRAVEKMLDSWKSEQDGTVNAYALKELKINSERLSSLISCLHSLTQVHDIVEITVLQYWYDPSWAGPYYPNYDLVFAEYSITVAIRVGWSLEEYLFRVEIIPVASC